MVFVSKSGLFKRLNQHFALGQMGEDVTSKNEVVLCFSAGVHLP